MHDRTQPGQFYPIRWTRVACHHIYGKAICDRAWRKWLRICQVPPRAVEVDKNHCLWLLALAWLKRQSPSGRGSQITLTDCILLLRSDPELGQHLSEAVGDRIYSDGLRGEELPRFIQQATGRRVSIRTLYRWAADYGIGFSVGRAVAAGDIDRLVSLASKNRAV